MPTLNWRTREQDLKTAADTEYRLLIEEEKYSYGDSDTGNIIVQGDNLEALKALLPFYAGQVKCIYIDPPYNTGSAFEHYDDNLEHTLWLSMMYPRLELLKIFLSEQGSIWITVDDSESHYLKIICDEIFGRNNFLANLIWEKSDSPRMDADFFSNRHDHILIWSRNISATTWNRIVDKENVPQHYDKIDKNGRKYYLKPLRAMGGQGDTRTARPSLFFPLIAPNGSEVYPIRQDGTDGAWRWSKEKIQDEIDRIDWIDGRKGWSPYFRIFADTNKGRPPETIWAFSEVGSNRTSKAEIKRLFPDEVPFSTPKPESLIERIVSIATNPGDYVLDSFLGSGTTAAVAHKMGRRYIGVEMGEQAKTHCAVRLKKVIEGEQGGISEAAGWKGGGGFRFFTLGEAVFDREGRIKPDISFEDLAAHIYFTETKTPLKRRRKKSPFLSILDGTAFALLYNGILGDKTINGGIVLTHATLNHIMHDIDMASEKKGEEFKYNQMVIYGEATRLPNVSLKHNNIEFKQTPYDIKVW
jgi:adenine-specific DNA-methyltransferase